MSSYGWNERTADMVHHGNFASHPSFDFIRSIAWFLTISSKITFVFSPSKRLSVDLVMSKLSKRSCLVEMNHHRKGVRKIHPSSKFTFPVPSSSISWPNLQILTPFSALQIVLASTRSINCRNERKIMSIIINFFQVL
jgi:hypothetical protein